MKIPNNDELIDTIWSIYQNIEQRLAPVITKHAYEVERLYPTPINYKKVDINQNFIQPLLKPEDIQANEEVLEELAVVVKNNPDYPMFWSALYVTLSEFFKRTGDLESYHEALSDSIIHSIHAKQYDEVEIFAEQLAQLHKSQGNLDHYKNELESILLINDTDNKQNTNIPQLYAHYGLAGVYKVTQNKTEHLRHLGNTLYVMQGPIDYEAYNIAQHEVGFSQKPYYMTIFNPCWVKFPVACHDYLNQSRTVRRKICRKYPVGLPRG